MSGIEIAGLVLGALPLVISGLQWYQDEGLSTARDWWRFRKNFNSFLVDVAIQQKTFTFHIESLLAQIVVSEDQLQALLSDPGNAEWEDPGLAKRLRERFPDTYILITNALQNLCTSVNALCHEIGLGDIQVHRPA